MMTTDLSMPANLVKVRGTELLASDTPEQYRQKLARITLDSMFQIVQMAQMVQFVGLLDAEGTVLDINQVALDAVGIKLSDVEGKPFWTTFWWQVSEEINKVLRESIRRASQGEFVRWDTEIYGRSGGKETIIIDASLMPVKDEQGNVVFITLQGCDITERKAQEQAQEREIARQRQELAKREELVRLDENRFRLGTIIDSADDGIISKDLNGIVGSWNEGACRMFGYSAKEMVGQPILRLIPKELHYEEDEILRKLRAGERINHYETRRIKKNGETVEVSVTISPIRDESGRIIGASKIARDISDRKRMERLLVQSEKLAATGRMAAAIAHEINNPLEALVNLIFLARQSIPADGKAHDYLVTAEGELERVSHIARQTLGYYRDTGSPAEVYLHDLIANVLTVYNSKLMSIGVSTDMRFNDLQKIIVSKGEMLQIFSNIIANAIDAMPQGGVLSISARNLLSSSGDGIQAVIRDNGTGIRQEHLQQVFEPFFTTKGDLGTGIGLWVAKQLVETRGGQISVASSTEKGNSGTTITIFIPFAIPVSRSNAERQ
jgi:PAS domain S-box-containing protein